MYDNGLFFAQKAEAESKIITKNNLQKGNFLLATIHRDNNTDKPERLNSIFSVLNKISKTGNTDIILPLHPRTIKKLKTSLDKTLHNAVQNNPNLKIISPVSYFDILVLEKNCRMILTDSGGLQKEAYFFQKPVIVLRPETEWIEIIKNGSGIIADANEEKIIAAYQKFNDLEKLYFPPIYGKGKAAEFICQKIIESR